MKSRIIKARPPVTGDVTPPKFDFTEILKVMKDWARK